MTGTERATILDAGGDPPLKAALRVAARALRSGEVVGLPTDTVYGLAVDATRPGAADRVFAVKQRPRGVQLPVLVAGVDQVESLVADIPELARELMGRFWPGALTLVLARRPGLHLDLGDDPSTIGIRCPRHPVARALCRTVGPLATTSANRHGAPAIHEAVEVAALEGVAVVLDGGRCAGAPSTVVDCRGGEPRLLRAGGLPWSAIVPHASA